MNMEGKEMVLGKRENQQIAKPWVQVRDISSIAEQWRFLNDFYKECYCTVIYSTESLNFSLGW